MVPVDGGRITGVEPGAGADGAITPVSGTGRAEPPSASGFSLRGRAVLDPSAPVGGNVGESVRGRTTSGTALWLCARLIPNVTTPAAVRRARSQDASGRSAARARTAPRC